MLCRAAAVLRRAPRAVPRRAFTVAIDGPAASGKSSTARAVAHELGFGYIDSGSIYRCATLLALRQGISDAAEDRAGLAALVGQADIDVRIRPGPRPAGPGQIVVPDVQVLLDGEDVSRAIRSPEVNRLVAAVASDGPVRDAVLRIQRSLAAAAESLSTARHPAHGGVVMDGRDIGTAVFPNAELKIYLDASAMARAIRRWDQMSSQGNGPAGSADAGNAQEQPPAAHSSVEDIARELEKRDYTDINRKHSPLRIAPDAVVIDNTNMTFERQVHAIADLARERMGVPRRHDDDDM
ncbi:hypothetical protein H4R18_005088 [Coemansia javaensis]|uniref:(d)CMP kinase n=1 Tax=Coemansia javaensis TaxID=2761396 RepID=A0A9W8H2L2_9FUNG|nr:hypothetical protein H4R18_005088 [Coemansia javaensis]